MSKVLFVCEGNSEAFLLYKILKKEFNLVDCKLEKNGNLVLEEKSISKTLLGNVENKEVYFILLGGESKLKAHITELCSDREFETFNSILFFMDADYKVEEETGFQRTEKAIKDVINIIKENRENKEVLLDYFISPNNKDDGMIENLLIEAINCKEIKNYIKSDVIPKVKQMEEAEITNEAKSTFIMIAATQNPLRVNTSSFITSCYDKLDKNNVSFKKFLDFIEKYTR